MRKIGKMALAMALAACGVLTATAERVHCAADTATAMEIVREFAQPGGEPGQIVVRVAERLVGVPYGEVNREDSLGRLQVRLDAFDKMNFVNAVVALAKTATQPGQPLASDFVNAFENVACRRGAEDGFTSIMLYGADWIVDNRGRGNVEEFTERRSEAFKTRSLDAISRNRKLFPALADSAAYDRQRMMEMGYRNHKIPNMKRQSLEWKDVDADMRDGDIVMLLCNADDYDIWEVGFVVRRDDGWHFIHASEKDGKVVERPEPLAKYIKRNAKDTYGWRWLRVK